MKTLTAIIELATSPDTKKQIALIWSKMPPSTKLTPTVEEMALAALRGDTWADLHCCVFACAREGFSRYLEIGSRRGHSLVLALAGNPEMKALAVDIWSTPEYNGEENSRALLNRTLDMLDAFATIVEGDSQVILPQLRTDGRMFDLITVDGDHEALPAEHDLNEAALLLEPNGAIIFDDIQHPNYALDHVWHNFKFQRPTWEFYEFGYGTGTGIGIKK
jgi:hypothetical protein